MLKYDAIIYGNKLTALILAYSLKISGLKICIAYDDLTFGNESSLDFDFIDNKNMNVFRTILSSSEDVSYHKIKGLKIKRKDSVFEKASVVISLAMGGNLSFTSASKLEKLDFFLDKLDSSSAYLHEVAEIYGLFSEQKEEITTQQFFSNIEKQIINNKKNLTDNHENVLIFTEHTLFKKLSKNIDLINTNNLTKLQISKEHGLTLSFLINNEIRSITSRKIISVDNNIIESKLFCHLPGELHEPSINLKPLKETPVVNIRATAIRKVFTESSYFHCSFSENIPLFFELPIMDNNPHLINLFGQVTGARARCFLKEHPIKRDEIIKDSIMNMCNNSDIVLKDIRTKVRNIISPSESDDISKRIKFSDHIISVSLQDLTLGQSMENIMKANYILMNYLRSVSV